MPTPVTEGSERRDPRRRTPDSLTRQARGGGVHRERRIEVAPRQRYHAASLRGLHEHRQMTGLGGDADEIEGSGGRSALGACGGGTGALAHVERN